MESEDINKIKIEILRDAFKDVVDTIRALDRKIVFLVSYNAIFLGFIVSIFLKYKEVEKLLPNSYEYFYCYLSILGFIWAFVLIGIMLNISPTVNPIDVFKSDEDKKFGQNIFFIFTDGKKKKLSLNKLIQSYDEINTKEKLEKLLYKEIGKVSFIRDIKMKNIKYSVWASFSLTFVFILIIVFSFLTLL